MQSARDGGGLCSRSCRGQAPSGGHLWRLGPREKDVFDVLLLREKWVRAGGSAWGSMYYPRESVGGGKFTPKRVRTRFGLLKTTAFRRN